MDKSKEFAGEVRSRLDKLTTRLVRVLKRVATYKFDPAVRILLFEVFSDGFTEGFPVRLFFYDKDWTEYFVQVKGKAEYPCDVDPGLLDLKNVYPISLEEKYDEEVEDPWSVAVETLLEWFAECWREAGGPRCKVPAFISQHDSYFHFNLKTKKWVKQDDIDLS